MTNIHLRYVFAVSLKSVTRRISGLKKSRTAPDAIPHKQATRFFTMLAIELAATASDPRCPMITEYIVNPTPPPRQSQCQEPEGNISKNHALALCHRASYIEEHYMEHIALADIALSGTCCKSKCSLLFKKYLRDTPITYLTKFRLRKSLSALLGSNSNIATIAYEYGFGGPSYYCETFKKYYGVSPWMYKKSTY